MNSHKKLDPSHTYFSRAGKASLSKYKILLDKDKILSDKQPVYRLPKVQTDPHLPTVHLGKMISEELESIKSVTPNQQKVEIKTVQPSAVFLSPGRKEIFPSTDIPDPGRYAISYSLVHKTPVVYSISKRKKPSEVPSLPDSFLAPNLHQFPDQHFKGIPFKFQTSRKDLNIGLPSPHEERFTVQNLISYSCSKYTKLGCPDMGKYAGRKEFYTRKEFSPDYSPNKEFVLPKLALDIKFESMTERKEEKEKDWMSGYDGKEERKSFFKDLKREDKKKKDKGSRPFSPSKFLSVDEEL